VAWLDATLVAAAIVGAVALTVRYRFAEPFIG
jgi:hypothetical protein